jgi:hypothetical protein
MKNWQSLDNGYLSSFNYSYEVLKNEGTGKYKVIFKGRRTWNQLVKVVRYYNNAPTDKNICLTVRSI